MKQIKNLYRVTAIALAIIVSMAGLSLTGCSSPTSTTPTNQTPAGGGGGSGGGGSNQTPAAGDYTFGNLDQTAGSVTAVTITPKSGKSTGAVSNIKYTGSATIPQTAGTYAVTFDVAAASGWNAASGLSAGNLVVNPEDDGNTKTFTSIAAFNTWLTAQPDYTLYNVKLNVSSLGGSSTSPGSAGKALRDNENKTVNLDLSGNTFTSIEEKAFQDCISLASVIIGNSVTSIGDDAFKNCYSLSVTIGNSVTSIGDGAFLGCYLFDGITIPNSVKSIGDCAFLGCFFPSVIIGNSVTSIGDGAFELCNYLTSVNIPNSVTSIGYCAFSQCKKLTAINVDSTNTAYFSQDGVLYNKNRTTLMQYPASKTDASFTIPNSVTSIGIEAFHGCINLTSITIPNSVKSIEGFAFSSCTSLTSITIPNSVKSIGGEAFHFCTSLTSITFQGTIDADKLGDNASTPSGIMFISPFDGNLREKYLIWGIGTYTREGYTWTKK